jgi:uncharacterized coiled-coil DUF342 family protein
MTKPYEGTNGIRKYWNRYVPHKCLDLRTDNPSMSEKAFQQMTSMIDGGRLLRYSNNACYVASPDEIPSNLPFVKIYKDETRHYSHKAPIEKTVIEYDKTVLTPENLSTFWDQWSNTGECVLETKRLREILAIKTNELKVLNAEITSMWGTDADKIDADAISLSLQSQKSNFENIIDEAMMSWRLSMDRVNDLKNDIKSIRARLLFLNQQIETEEETIAFNEQGLQKCRDTQAACVKDKGLENASLSVLLEKNSDLRSNIIDFNKKIKELDQGIEQSHDKLQTCTYTKAMTQDAINTLQSKLDEYSGKRDKCRKDLEEYKLVLQESTDSYNLSSNTYNECKAQAPILEKSISTCADDLRGCANVLMGLSGSDMDIRDIRFDQPPSFFDPVEEKIKELTKQKDVLRQSLKECKSKEAALSSDIDELQNRNAVMREQKESTINMLQDIQRNTQSTLARLHAKSRESSLEYRKSVAFDNMKRKIASQCSGDGDRLQSDYNNVINDNSSLKMKLKSVTNPQKACKSDCEIDLSQCVIHTGHPDLCTKRESGGLIVEPGDKAKVEITVYDQKNEKIKTFEMSVSGETECIFRTGAQELSSIEINNSNTGKRTNMTLYFKAGAGGCVNNPTPSMFRNPSSMVSNKQYLDYVRPELIGGVIVDKTIFRKINLYRGIDSVTFLLA